MSRNERHTRARSRPHTVRIGRVDTPDGAVIVDLVPGSAAGGRHTCRIAIVPRGHDREASAALLDSNAFEALLGALDQMRRMFAVDRGGEDDGY